MPSVCRTSTSRCWYHRHRQHNLPQASREPRLYPLSHRILSLRSASSSGCQATLRSCWRSEGMPSVCCVLSSVWRMTVREVCVIAYRRGRLQFNIAFFKDLHNCLSNAFIHVVYLTTIFCWGSNVRMAVSGKTHCSFMFNYGDSFYLGLEQFLSNQQLKSHDTKLQQCSLCKWLSIGFTSGINFVTNYTYVELSLWSHHCDITSRRVLSLLMSSFLFLPSPHRSHLDIAGGECTSDATVYHTEDTVWYDAINDRWRCPAASHDARDRCCPPDPGLSVCLEPPRTPCTHPWLPPRGTYAAHG